MKTNRSLLHISEPSEASLYSGLLVCKNTNCRFHYDGNCQLMTDPEDCKTREQIEPEESPWHKDFPNSTPIKRVEWDNNLNETH